MLTPDPPISLNWATPSSASQLVAVAACPSVRLSFSPCVFRNSYTAAPPVEERRDQRQPAGAPVGPSITNIKDMLSTRVYPAGLPP